MKQDEKKVYVSLGVDIQIPSKDDIISTSGFLGGDDGIYAPSNQTPTSFEQQEPYPDSSSFNFGSNI